MRVIIFRAAVPADSDDLFDWRNDEGTREASISRELVPRADHDRWFADALQSEARLIIIAKDPATNDSIGTARFDSNRGVTEVSINLNPRFRGRGLATEVLGGAIEAFRADGGHPGALAATIRHENLASARIFAAVGFSLVASDNQFDFYRLD